MVPNFMDKNTGEHESYPDHLFIYTTLTIINSQPEESVCQKFSTKLVPISKPWATPRQAMKTGCLQNPSCVLEGIHCPEHKGTPRKDSWQRAVLHILNFFV